MSLLLSVLSPGSSFPGGQSLALRIPDIPLPVLRKKYRDKDQMIVNALRDSTLIDALMFMKFVTGHDHRGTFTSIATK